MIIEICGDLGSGKTLFMTLLGYICYKKGYLIMSNYHLNFPYQPINLKDLESIQKCCILIDEMHIFVDSRSSMKDFNKKFSYFILQSRKRQTNLIYTTQYRQSVDKRVRNLTDISIIAEKQKDIQGNLWFKYVIFNSWLRQPKVIRLHEDLIKFVYRLYDTNQIIKPIDI